MIYKEKILETIVKDFFDTNIIKDEDVLLVALSGGMDSMCLLDAFYKLQSERDFKLKAIHVHHGIRDDEADRDLKFTRDYCKQMGVDFIEERVEARKYSEENNLTLEEAARILRYKIFEKHWEELSKENESRDVYVLVAHHEKDQVETVIHNMIRGTGIKGIAGMKKVNGYILRPLLYINKSEIEKYIEDYDVPYVNDSTNDDPRYTRNFIRKEILEKFELLNARASLHIADLARRAEEINNYIEKESKEALDALIVNETSESITIDLKKFRLKDVVIKVGVIREIFNKLVSTLKDITNINVEDIIELSDNEKGGHLDLPYNITIDKKQNDLTFTKNEKNLSMSRRKKK